MAAPATVVVTALASEDNLKEPPSHFAKVSNGAELDEPAKGLSSGLRDVSGLSGCSFFASFAIELVGVRLTMLADCSHEKPLAAGSVVTVE